MNRKIFNYLEIAAQAALGKETVSRNFIHGCVGIRSDGAIVKSLNSSSDVPNRKLHAEYRVAAKMDAGGEIYVSRVRLDTMGFGISKPCKSCIKVMTSRGVKRVYYTIGPGEYGVIYL
jgi:deoxycytidylate deaminase